MADPVVIEPDRFFETFWPGLLRLQRSYGCIISLDNDHRSQAKGTGVFVRIDGHELLVTACHVAKSELMRSGRVFVLMPRRETVVGQESVPKMTALRIDEVVWSSSEMDVAVLAGVDVAPMETGSEFIDGSSHADVATKIRSRWRRVSSETTSLPFFVLGFPDFGHLVDEDRRIETLTSVPLPGYVTQLEEHAWRGDGAVPPQLLLEVDAHEPSPANNEHDRAGLLRRRLFDPSQDSPFGGYSGGPVAVAGSDGLYLIGVVKEGVHLFGQFRVVGTPWDDVVAALRRSAEWQRFCAASR